MLVYPQACPESQLHLLALSTVFSQRSLEQNRFGRLTVRCHYEAAEQRLAVEVLHAADLLPLDANGKTRQPQLAVGVGWSVGGRAHNVSSRPE